MGDRISIQFENNGQKSVFLFNHWDGSTFLKEAIDYVISLKQKINPNGGQSIDRLDPNIVMVDFIRHLTKNMKLICNNLYLCTNESDGDNSDNGNFIINLI